MNAAATRARRISARIELLEKAASRSWRLCSISKKMARVKSLRSEGTDRAEVGAGVDRDNSKAGGERGSQGGKKQEPPTSEGAIAETGCHFLLPRV